MGTFTMELREVIALEQDPGTGLRLGLNDYPIWDKDYRIPLNQKIIDHFYMREIGRETIEQFRFAMRRKMREIMPYYNQLYVSTQLEYDPLSNFDLKTLRSDSTAETGETDSTTAASGASNSAARTVNSEFPQSQLDADGDYATSASDATSASNSTNSATGKNTSSNTSQGNGQSTTTGRQGSAPRLVMEYRAAILNVDMMVINDLNELFMGVYDNGEEFMPRVRGYLL